MRRHLMNPKVRRGKREEIGRKERVEREKVLEQKMGRDGRENEVGERWGNEKIWEE